MQWLVRRWPFRLLGVLLAVATFSACSPVAGLDVTLAPPSAAYVAASPVWEHPSATAQTISAPRPSLLSLPLDTQNPVPIAYWGAYISGSLYGFNDVPPWDVRPIDVFESHADKKISILHWGRRWYHNGEYYPFSASLMETVRQRGELSLLDWNSEDYGVTPEYNQPIFSLANIISGTHDAYIQQWATDAKNWGHPFFLRFDDEMNGGWEPWSEQRNGNSPGQYVQAWRHVHDIFTQVGATNVTWVWCPNIEYSGTIPLDELYPGDAYVDWTGIDGYNWGAQPDHPLNWTPFYDVFKPTYDHILRIAPDKPVMIGEFASSEHGGSKADWITDAFTRQLPSNFPKVRAVVWFNVNADNMDWVIETSPSAQAAFAAALASSYYAGNQFGDLTTSPIPPPYRYLVYLPISSAQAVPGTRRR